MGFVTECRICGAVLTITGSRIKSATYDSVLAKKYPKPSEEGKTWAFCEECYEKLQGEREL